MHWIRGAARRMRGTEIGMPGVRRKPGSSEGSSQRRAVDLSQWRSPPDIKPQCKSPYTNTDGAGPCGRSGAPWKYSSGTIARTAPCRRPCGLCIAAQRACVLRDYIFSDRSSLGATAANTILSTMHANHPHVFFGLSSRLP